MIPRNKIKNWSRFETEVKILQTLDHPNVIKLYEYFEDETNVYLVTEICEGGELYDRIIQVEYFNEERAAKIFKQICQVLNYCHSMNIAHRDLKPENFLFVNNRPDSDIKLIDFGLSKICSEGRLQRMNTRAGTPFYIAPEVLKGDFDLSADMWSAGCILYILLCGYPPFFGETNQEILRAVAKGTFDFEGEEWDAISEDCKDLIRKLLCKPNTRLTAAEALSHSWIRSHHRECEQTKLRKAVQKLNLANFKQFGQAEKIKKVAMMAIAVQLDPSEIRELKSIFMALDRNGDGFISIEELQNGLGYRENYESLV
jgi:calcium-dependent protein kinase